MMPFYDPRFPGDGKARHFQLILRRRPDDKDQLEVDSEVRQELSQIISYLEALRDNSGEPEQAPALPAPNGEPTQAARPPLRLTLPKDRDSVSRRFKLARVRLGSKINSEPRLAERDILQDLALLTDSKLPAGDPAPGEPRVEAIPVPLAPLAVTPSPAQTPRARWPFALAGAAVLAAAGWTTFLWVHAPAPAGAGRQSVANQAAESTINAEATRTAELALRAVQGGRLEEASGVLADARKNGVALPGLRYQAALLALRQGDSRAATDWLAQSIATRESVPECLYLSANVAATNGDYTTVCEQFEEAAGHAEFSPRYFFFWGEALRRLGHSAQALTQFERALLCRPNSTDADLIRFKMGLAQIEAGDDEKFAGDLRFLLAQKNVSGDTLLLAAAVEINRAAYPAAAAYVQRAKAAMPPALLAARLRDFLFRVRAQQSDLAAVWPATAPASAVTPVDPAAPPRARVVIDPATRTLAEADPATW